LRNNGGRNYLLDTEDQIITKDGPDVRIPNRPEKEKRNHTIYGTGGKKSEHFKYKIDQVIWTGKKGALPQKGGHGKRKRKGVSTELLVRKWQKKPFGKFHPDRQPMFQGIRPKKARQMTSPKEL